jgi:hypothetical protein
MKPFFSVRGKIDMRFAGDPGGSKVIKLVCEQILWTFVDDTNLKFWFTFEMWMIVKELWMFCWCHPLVIFPFRSRVSAKPFWLTRDFFWRGQNLQTLFERWIAYQCLTKRWGTWPHTAILFYWILWNTYTRGSIGLLCFFPVHWGSSHKRQYWAIAVLKPLWLKKRVFLTATHHAPKNNKTVRTEPLKSWGFFEDSLSLFLIL